MTTRQLVVFDLDGTLAESKSPVDAEMARLIDDLLAVIEVAVISGGDWPQFETQLLSRLQAHERLRRLSVLPVCGTKFYRYASSWTQAYAHDLTATDKDTIVRALHDMMSALGYSRTSEWGDVIEDRGSQITFSALGQAAPLAVKREFDPDCSKRLKMKLVLDARLPHFSVRVGGTTSVDITRAGIDKGYGIRQLRDTLEIPIADMVFIGDALFPGGNDQPAQQAGATSIRTRDPEETKRLIETIIAFHPTPSD
ncbi:MAG: HAD-superfamily hydrolase subfamily [Ilumatobacteraceae bacterium]|nr:HAD-superfamily hydrolase subfamily [Ilumatobacteraceae bacterium]